MAAAVCMCACRYTHNQDWDAAMRIAEQYDPTAISDILAAQAKAAIARKQYQVGCEAQGVYQSYAVLSRESKRWHMLGAQPCRMVYVSEPY